MPLVEHDPDEMALEPRGAVLASAFDEPSGRPWIRPDAVPETAVGERDGVIVVTPAGALSDPLPACLAEGLAALIADRPAVIDVSGIVMVSAGPVVGLAGWAVGASRRPGQCCVVCARASGRALLRSWRVTRCLTVFGSVGDALQARRFAQDGYGRGWQPDQAALGTSHGAGPPASRLVSTRDSGGSWSS